MTDTFHIVRYDFRRASVNCGADWIVDTGVCHDEFRSAFKDSGGAMIFTEDYPHYCASQDTIVDGYGVFLRGNLIRVFPSEKFARINFPTAK